MHRSHTSLAGLACLSIALTPSLLFDVNAFANEDFEATARKRVQEKQIAWLHQVLGNNPNRWTIVVQHQPIYAVAKGRE